MIVSAQEATKTRLCAAERCEQDAETNSRLCWRCAKKDSVRLHVQPERPPDTLRCCSCTKDLPDDSFSRKADAPHRRYRHHECRDCTRTRRTLSRLTETRPPRTQCQALNTGQQDRPSDQRRGQPCRAYAAPNSPYCSVHKSLA